MEFDPELERQGSESGVPLWMPPGEDSRSDTVNQVPSGSKLWEDDSQESEDEGIESIPSLEPQFEIGAEVDDKSPILGGDQEREIKKSVEHLGVDALGWYASFHCIGYQWGAYVKKSGMAYLVQTAFRELRAPLEVKMQLAFHAILNHELFHFATDYAISQAELVYQEPWWQPAKIGFRQSQPPYCLLEESLANAYMLKAFRTAKPELRIRGKQDALRQFSRAQPPGYHEGWKVRRKDWPFHLDQLAREYGMLSAKGSNNPLLWSANTGFDWPEVFPMRPRIDWRFCPVFLVDDRSRYGISKSWLEFFSRLDRIVEAEGFKMRLSRMDSAVQKAWEKTKHRLQSAITNGSDFKRWPKDGPEAYSVRVNNSVRAHLRRLSNEEWLAVAIGGHKEMGHG